MIRKLAFICAVGAFLGAPAVSLAAPIVIEFSVVSGIAGPVTGFGSVVTDDSNLLPGSSTLDFADLIDMTLTLNNIPAAPATTTFTRADLTALDLSWILSVNGAGVIIDLNFFMRDDGTNADGYSIEGFSPFNFVLCDGTSVVNSCGNSPTLDRLVVTPGEIHAAVPEPSTMALFTLAFVALGAARVRRGRS